MRSFRIAAIPLRPRHSDVPGSADHLIDWIRRAGATGAGAELVVFPEGILCAYDLDHIQDCALSLDSPVLARIQDTAAQARTIASVGYLERSPSGYYVSNLHLGRDIFINYRKCHLTESEKKCCLPGDHLEPQSLPMATIGTLICYDSAHPRAVETLIRRGAQVLVHSSCHSFYQRGQPRNHPQAIAHRRDHILKYWRAKAYDYSCYAVQVDNVGEASNGEWFPGYTAIFGPDGSILAEADQAREEMVIADLDAQHLAHCRENWVGHYKALQDARPELYE
jgi:(R)-amidase